jgi:hypothetical protein
MIQTDLIGAIVECPTELDQSYKPIAWGYGLVRGAYARRTSGSTFVEVIVQTLDHVIGKVPTPRSWQGMGGALRSWDLKNCRVMSLEKVEKVFAPRPT